MAELRFEVLFEPARTGETVSDVCRRCDAHAPVLASQKRRLTLDRGEPRLSVDVVNLPHHGSRANLSPELVDLVDCELWIYSTDGAIFRHPDAETAARIVVHRPGMELIFNYRPETTGRYDSPELCRVHGFRRSRRLILRRGRNGDVGEIQTRR